MAAVVVAVGVVVPVGTALPTVSTSSRPRPVAARVGHVPLKGVDARALRSVEAARSAAAIDADLRETEAAESETADAGSPTGRADDGAMLAVLTAPRTGAGFQTVGVSWRRTEGTELAVAVRTRSNGTWGAWTAISQEEEPTGESAPRSGTEPLYAGRSDGVQARVEVVAGKRPADLRVDIIDPGTSAFDAHAGTSPAGSASAAASTPAILPRAAWGADESRRRGTPEYMATIKAGVLHHTAGVNNYPAAQVPKILRGDYAYHLSRGWNDIGYNFLVDRFGRTWEGRAGGISQAVVGAHAGGFNSYTFGVSMIGNYDEVKPSAASLEAVARIFAWKLDLYHRDPQGTTRLESAGGGTAKYPEGRTVTLPVIMGHRDVGSTACPGRYLYPTLAGIRDRVATLMRAAILEPSPSAATVPAATGTAAISATSLTKQSWQLTVTMPCAGAGAGAGAGAVDVVRGTSRAGRRFAATWDGRTASGARARAGAYVLTLTATSSTGTARPVTSTVLLVPPAPPDEPASIPTTGIPGTYVPVTPTPLLDTRAGAPLGPDGRVDVPVLGRAGVPATGVTSVVMDVATVCPSSGTYVSTYPTGGRASGTALLYAPAGAARQSLVTVPVSASGAVSVANATGVADVVVNVVGYHAASAVGTPPAGAGLVPMPLQRIYDTRRGAGLKGGVNRTVAIPDVGGVPSADVRAVVVQLTVYGASRPGALSAVAYGTTPTTSAAVFAARRDVDSRAVVAVKDGRITLRSTVSTHVAVDVVGVYAAGGLPYTAVPVHRVLDTRSAGRMEAGSSRVLTVTGGGVPVGAKAVMVDLVGAAPSVRTAFVAWPSDEPKASGTDLRVPVGDTRSNPALVRVAPDGTITVQNAAGAADLIVDVLGYYG